MSIREFVAGELIDIIEWLDESRDTMVWRFARPNNEIKNGAQLIVRPGQVAVFIEQGDVADVFVPGRHELTTGNLPVLSRLRGWKYGFESPFKAEVVFVNTTQFTNRKWGTSNPVVVRDPALGPVRLRAFGTFAVRIADATIFVREIVGTNALFTVDLIDDQLRDLVVARVSSMLSTEQISVLDIAGKYGELASHVQERVGPQFTQYGLEITQLVIENVSLPAEVEAAIDQRSKVAVIGSLDQYTKLQTTDALRDAARNPGGGASAGVGIGMGAAMAQAAMRPAASAPPVASDEPPPLPQDLWWYAVAGQRKGPTDVAGLAASGAVGPATLVWKKGMDAWTRAADVPELAAVIRA